MKGNLGWKKLVTVALSLSLVLPFATELKANAEAVSYDSGSTIYETNLEAGESKTVRYTINVDKAVTNEELTAIDTADWYVAVASGNLTVVEDIDGSDMHLDYSEATGKVTGTIDIDVTIPASANEGTSTIVFYNDCGSHITEAYQPATVTFEPINREALTYTFDADASDYYQNETLTFSGDRYWTGSTTNHKYYEDEIKDLFGISDIQHANAGDVLAFTAPVKKYTTDADHRLNVNLSECTLTETTTFRRGTDTVYVPEVEAYWDIGVWKLNGTTVSLSNYGISGEESFVPSEVYDFTVYVNNVTDATKKAATLTATAPRAGAFSYTFNSDDADSSLNYSGTYNASTGYWETNIGKLSNSYMESYLGIKNITNAITGDKFTYTGYKQENYDVIANNEKYDAGYDYVLASVNVNYSRKQAAANNSNESSDNGSTESVPAIVAANVNGMQLDSWTAIDSAIEKITAADLAPVADADGSMMKIDICGSANKTVPKNTVEALSAGKNFTYLHLMIGEADAITFCSNSDISGYKETDFTHTDTVTGDQRLIDFSVKQDIGTTVLLHTTVPKAYTIYAVYFISDSGESKIHTAAVSTKNGQICFPISETGKYLLKPFK